MQLLRRTYTFLELSILKKSLFKLLFNPKKIFNFILVKISGLLKLNKCLGLPVNILIDPSGECNYRCVKCARFSDNFRDDGLVLTHKHMPFDHFCRIIDEIGDTLLTLRLWRYGEPLLNRDIYRMIKYAKRKNILVSISSSLSALSKKRAEDLIKSGLDYLVISFDGASEETYQLYHGRPCFNQAVNNIKILVSLKKELKSVLPFIDLQFIVMKENEKEMEKIKQLAYEMGVNKLSFFKLDVLDVNFNAFDNFTSQTDILPPSKELTINAAETKRINYCKIPWEETLICYSGLVLPCTPDYGQENKIGRVFENGSYTGFKKLWNNKEYRNLRQRIKNDIDSINCCNICTKRNNTVKQQI